MAGQTRTPPKHHWRHWLGGMLVSGSAALWAAEAPGNAETTGPAETPAHVAMARMGLVGETLLRVWGFDIYTARLLAPPGFNASEYERQAFALELSYLRSFDGRDIAQRSIDEMQDQGAMAPELARRWQAQLDGLFPDVRKGDRILGVHLPDKGAQFYLNDVPLGSIDDADLARRFFGIWLSPATSQPAMRQALISGARLPR